jgi:hypothetical protein
LGYLTEEVGYPFNQIPTKAFVSFKGGVESWGSMCGALVAPIAVINLVAEGDIRAAMVNELMAWYKEFPFPEFQPKGLNLPGFAVNSSLCHVSVTTWMKESGFGPRSAPERSERCGGLTGDVCKFTVQMLNKYYDNAFAGGEFKPAAVVGECMACHGEKVPPYAHGKESCVECHGDPHK